MIPESIGGYKILSELGRGAMGVVYHAQDSAIGRSVAIKVLRVDAGTTLEESAELRQRLIREASAAGKISHPGIVTVHQLGEDGQCVFIVMEYVEGSSLENLLTKKPSLDLVSSLDVLRQMAEALDYAHKAGVVHRDVKPANIMVREDGRVKIADFGIAKLTASAAKGMTATGVSLGSPAYMSPEQIQATQIDGRADQFALGTIAFQMLTGRMPFKGNTAHTVMFQIVTADPFQIAPGDIPLTPAVRAVVARALAKHPQDRYPDCATFIHELTAAVGLGAPKAKATAAPPVFVQPPPQPRPQAKPPARPQGKRPLLPILIGGFALLALIGEGAYWYINRTCCSAPPTTPPSARQPAAGQPAAGQPAARQPAAGQPAAKPISSDASPLLAAVAAGNLEAVKAQLAKGANVEQADHDGTTPLMLAAQTNPAIVEALLGAGAQVEAQDTHGRSALNRASAAGNEDAMRLLLDHQANVNTRAGDLSTPLMEAVAHAKLYAVQLLLDRGADVNLPDSNNNTPLMIAAEKDPGEFVKLLLTHGAKRGLKDSKGRIAFQRAVEGKNAAAIALLR
jgi:predicted Ser/Thr protein kinase